MTMANFKAWKKRTAALSKKIVRKARAFRWNSAKVSKNDDEQIETMDTFDELPLLRAVPKKAIKKAWDSSDQFKDMSDFAAASAMITASFSHETKSTVSSSDLYHSGSGHEERIEFPNFHKRDIYMADGVKPVNDNHVEKKKSQPNDFTISPRTIPSYSISGSMLCGNIEKGKIKDNSTSATTRPRDSVKPAGFPANAVMGSALFRTMKLDSSIQTMTETELTKQKLQKTIANRTVCNSLSVDSHDDEDSPYVTIQRTNSSDGAHSSVSSVTMYSSYQNDPLVRASNSLLDILRSNRFNTFEKCEEETASALHEA